MDKGLGNKADSELNIINTISPADIAFIMSTTYALCWFASHTIKARVQDNLQLFLCFKVNVLPAENDENLISAQP